MSSHRVRSRLFVAIAALAALVQLSVPHGWMIASAAQGLPTLVPCPTSSPQFAALGKAHVAHRAATKVGEVASHGDHSAHSITKSDAGKAVEHGASAHPQRASGHTVSGTGNHGDHDDHSALSGVMCDFAALSAPATLPEAPAIRAPLPATPNVIPSRIAYVFPGRGLAAPPPPSTGPPIIS
ncbi:hypothetical protein [Qipengyuania spongiae]|uniref:DUF2946 domain-containing protein n=1 Tax=Qipengyuania spongiae TaxID=2909673 RepID=A0ABY5SXR2_9SPHN|nr:hypothetical protein [Qipengyuania spongiae]UVI39327.1 hypothetical protein L1F33_14040 [Qipengyuania spongiae]